MNADPKPPVIDRRALRTRRLLRDALIALMLERGWERLTVQDLCDRADVGDRRSTCTSPTRRSCS